MFCKLRGLNQLVLRPALNLANLSVSTFDDTLTKYCVSTVECYGTNIADSDEFLTFLEIWYIKMQYLSKSCLPTFNVHTTPQQISRTWWVGCRKSCDHSNKRRLVGNLNKAFLLITVNCKNGIWNIHALFWGFGSCVTKCTKALHHFSAGDWRYCGYSLNKFGTACWERGLFNLCYPEPGTFQDNLKAFQLFQCYKFDFKNKLLLEFNYLYHHCFVHRVCMVWMIIFAIV